MDLEGAFRSACKVLFGQEVGTLSDFHDYFSEMVMPFQVQHSCLSGKDVILSVPYYPTGSRFISQEEMPKLVFEPLHPNEIKDVDSLFAAANERKVFCGNKILGKCESVSRVDNCVDCAFVENSHNVWQDRFCAYLSYVRESEFMFGNNALASCRYSLRSQEGVEYTRCFETHYSSRISDAYYAFNCIGCQDVIFGFNLRSKRNVIGNLELPKDKYLELKAKLIGEIAEKLKKEKRIFSIADAANHGISKTATGKAVASPYLSVPQKIEDAFRKTTKIVLEREYSDANGFSEWLLARALVVKKIIGANGEPTYKIADLPVVKDIHHSRLTTVNDALRSAEKHISPDKNIKLANLMEFAGKDTYFTFEFIDGTNEGNVDVTSVFNANNICRAWDATNSKDSGFTTAVVKSDFVFGGGFRSLHCHFALDCQDSVGLTACLGVDSSNNCRNSYFCHNCENLDNAIFCFNTKSKRYAVCNTEVGREEFLRIKKILLDYVNQQLENKRKLDFNVFQF